jgi:hypothetical protein
MMSMSYQLDKANSVIEVRIDRPLPVEEQQKILPKIVSAATDNGFSKWLIILTTTEMQDTNQARLFTEFAFDHLKLYISRLAVVCDPSMRSRVREVTAPIANQEKPVGIFSSEEEARAWLTD